MRNFLLILLVLLVPVFVAAKPALAAASYNFSDNSGLKDAAGGVGYNTGLEKDSISVIIGQVINAILSLIGVVFMVLIWLGALDIVGANGDQSLYKKGKDRIKNGAIGILVIFIAYLFTKVVLGILTSTGIFKT